MPYKSAHHALICLFVDHSRPGHSGWQDLYDPRSRDDIRMDLRDVDVGAVHNQLATSLHGMEEIAGEAAMVWKHLARMDDTRAAVLILRTCPPTMRHQSIPGATLQHPAFEAALRWMTDASLGAVNGLSHFHARRDAVRRATGGKVNVGRTADRCDVSRRTIERLNGEISRWLVPIEEQAWREIGDRLAGAKLIEN